MRGFRLEGIRCLLWGLCAAALTFGQPAPVLETGQKRCYDDDGRIIGCRGTGQDGELRYGVRAPARRFRDNRDGTVTDRLTNLIWLKNADCFGAQVWSRGLELSNTLANGQCGLQDQSRAGEWRMANIVELQSLLDYGNEGFALPNGHPFANVSGGTYWTSTQAPAAPPLGWFITLSIGPTVFDVKVNRFHVWPVRGGLGRDARLPKTGQTTCWDPLGRPIDCRGTGQDGDIQAGVPLPSPRFTDNRDGSVTDNLTGLMWLKNANCLGFFSFSDALAATAELADPKCGLTDNSRAGDWRLPNIRELQSLQVYNAFAPNLTPGHPFLNVQPTLTWASTSAAGFAAQGWFAIFGVGPSVFEDKAVPLWVWPVKGGQRTRAGLGALDPRPELDATDSEGDKKGEEK